MDGPAPGPLDSAGAARVRLAANEIGPKPADGSRDYAPSSAEVGVEPPHQPRCQRCNEPLVDGEVKAKLLFETDDRLGCRAADRQPHHLIRAVATIDREIVDAKREPHQRSPGLEPLQPCGDESQMLI